MEDRTSRHSAPRDKKELLSVLEVIAKEYRQVAKRSLSPKGGKPAWTHSGMFRTTSTTQDCKWPQTTDHQQGYKYKVQRVQRPTTHAQEEGTPTTPDTSPVEPVYREVGAISTQSTMDNYAIMNPSAGDKQRQGTRTQTVHYEVLHNKGEIAKGATDRDNRRESE